MVVPGTIYDNSVVGVVFIHKKVRGGRAELQTHWWAGSTGSDSGEGGGGDRKARRHPPGTVEEVQGAR